jgi:hypothetical protein
MRGRLAMLPGGEPYGLFKICRTSAAVYRSPAGPVKRSGNGRVPGPSRRVSVPRAVSTFASR